MKLEKQGLTRVAGTTSEDERFTVSFQLGINSPADLPSIRNEIIRRVNAHDVLVEALIQSQKLFEKALPKFNWGASFLNAEAIKLLNDVPIEVAKALALVQGSKNSTTPDSAQETGIQRGAS